LALEKAFKKDNLDALMNKILLEDPHPIESFVSNRLKTLIQRMIEKDPKNRISLMEIRNLIS
jgi:serine/threonine protein kinase